MRDDATYRAVVFGALRALTVEAPNAYVDDHDLFSAVNRWAAVSGLGPIPFASFRRIVERAGYRSFHTERRCYFAGLTLKEES